MCEQLDQMKQSTPQAFSYLLPELLHLDPIPTHLVLITDLVVDHHYRPFPPLLLGIWML